jgi:hypothetical protein
MTRPGESAAKLLSKDEARRTTNKLKGKSQKF